MKDLRFRQIHLDYHTNETIDGIASAFDPDDFVATLKKAHVNSITLFARCHHGMIYYDSKVNPERVHPHLTNKHLLHDQIDACHKAGIRTPIYTTVQWDYYTAREHREWVSMNENGQAIGESGAPQLPLAAGFYDSLCLNTGYRDFIRKHILEILTEFHPIDGLFLDIVFPIPCACPSCKKRMLELGLNPAEGEDRYFFSQMTIDEWQKETTNMIQREAPEATVFYNRGHIGFPHRASKDSFTHLELESLPSGIWGYLDFPCTVRYARTLGLDYLSHTGKFHTMWGDYNSYKNKAALEFECFQMLALGSKCLIGDQLNPDGRLSPEVYDLIGSVYAQVEEKEPWCEKVVPDIEIGVFTLEEFRRAGSGSLPKSILGAVRMLQECAFQFDVIDSCCDFEKYRLLLLPDEIPVNDQFAEKLEAYIASGGFVIATGTSGLKPDQSDFAVKFGVSKRKEQPVDIYGNEVVLRVTDRGDYCQYILPNDVIGKELPKSYHVMYTRGLAVDALEDADVLMNSYSTVFDRDYRHFCSHRQSPCSGIVDHPAIVKKGGTIYFSHPIFTQYQYNAPLWCKKIMKDAILLLIGQPILSHDGPSSLVTAVNDQPVKKRKVIHLLHYIPERRCDTIDIIEDVIPVYQVQCKLRIEKQISSVKCQPQNQSLSFMTDEGFLQFTVPAVNGHQIVEVCYEEK